MWGERSENLKVRTCSLYRNPAYYTTTLLHFVGPGKGATRKAGWPGCPGLVGVASVSRGWRESKGAPSDIVNDDGICSSDGDTQDGLFIDGTDIGIRSDTDAIETTCTKYCD